PGGRLIGEPSAVQRGEEPIAGAVAGEDAARTVAAVRRRRQSANQDAGRRIPEAGHRTPPIFLCAESCALLVGNAFAPGHQPRALPTTDNLFLNGLQLPGRYFTHLARRP